MVNGLQSGGCSPFTAAEVCFEGWEACDCEAGGAACL